MNAISDTEYLEFIKAHEEKKNAPKKVFRERLLNLKDEKSTNEAEAQAIGVGRQAYQKWIAGKSLPDAESLVKIADYYGCSTDYLLGRVPDPDTNADIAVLCDKFRLSGKAIDALEDIADYTKMMDTTLTSDTTNQRNVLSDVLSHNDVMKLHMKLQDYANIVSSIAFLEAKLPEITRAINQLETDYHREQDNGKLSLNEFNEVCGFLVHIKTIINNRARMIAKIPLYSTVDLIEDNYEALKKAYYIAFFTTFDRIIDDIAKDYASRPYEDYAESINQLLKTERFNIEHDPDEEFQRFKKLDLEVLDKLMILLNK